MSLIVNIVLRQAPAPQNEIVRADDDAGVEPQTPIVNAEANVVPDGSEADAAEPDAPDAASIAPNLDTYNVGCTCGHAYVCT